MLGDVLAKSYLDSVDQVIPQCSIFLCAIIFRKHIQLMGETANDLMCDLESNYDIYRDTLIYILQFAEDNPQAANRSWPNLLKSQNFFNDVMSYIETNTEIREE